MKSCRVPGCTQAYGKGAQGYCAMHSRRIARTGSVGPLGYLRPPDRSTAERVYSRLSLDGDCWNWTGATRNGYGAFGVDGRVEYVHRWVYEDMVGPLPDGLVIDHLCINRLCANPYHLDVVTRAVNNARGGLRSGSRRVA
jgi:hypothetical protein